MSKKTCRIRFLLGGIAMFLGVAAPSMADTWWNQAYSKRAPVTITNPGGGALPTANMSAEVSLGLGSAIRPDMQDVRALYTPDNGNTWTELDRKVFRDPPLPGAWIVENANAGSTGYSSLPAGAVVPATLVNGDDGGATVTLPFSFPFGATTSNKVFMSIDGYLVPGANQPISQYGQGNATTAGIYPFTSDYTTLITGTGMYYAADNNGPGGMARAIFRWEVAESGKTDVIAKFAAILYANGDIRFVYSNLVQPTSADVGAATKYGEMSYGVEFNGASNGIIHFPTDNYPTSATFSNHPDILYTASGVTPSLDSTRVVFRLVTPLSDGATSTGQYYIYYGNPSPTAPPSNVKNVFDYTADASAGTVGQPAADWIALQTGTATIENAYGVKSIVLRNTTSGVSHPEYIVSASAMPKFKDVELLTRFVPPGGENEIAPLMRVVNDPADPNYGGAMGYATDGFGSQQGFVSYVNPVTSQGPAQVGPFVAGANPTGIAENVLARYQGQILNGKKWMDSETQPMWITAKVDRTASTPQHNSVNDPIYDQAGGTGFGSYSTQGIAVQYVALRELRTNSTPGTVATVTPTETFIQGTVSSSVNAYNPLATATVHIVGGSTDVTLPVGPNGDYRIVLPAGSYSVTASERFHTAATTTNVAPSASGQTNFTLVYVGATASGVVRYGLDKSKLSGAKVTLIDAAGMFVEATTTDANGAYSIKAPVGGTYTLGVEAANGTGDRKVVDLASAAVTTVNFATKLVSNGDVEIPNAANTAPDQWTNAFDAPGAYLYTQDQNHTPGGKWSIAIKDPSSPAGQGNNLSCWNPPPSGFYDLPVRSDIFGVRVSVWVYFTKTGQKGRLRLRNNWPVAGVDVVAGQAPPASNDNQGGLVNGVVPVGQWYEIASKVPAGTALANGNALQVNLYAYNAAGGGADGIVYFDDLTITQTPVAQVYGQVKDETGAPVPNAFVGTMSNAGGLADNILVDAPVLGSDENGNYVLYLAAPGDALVGAWAYPTPNSGVLPNYGYVTDVKTVTAVANPATPTDFVIRRATNVAKGATFTAKDDAGNNRGTDAGLPPAAATDDSLATRWASSTPTGATSNITMLFDLGSAKSIDQVELFWERAWSEIYSLELGNDPNNTTSIFSAEAMSTHGIVGVDYSAYNDGPIQVFRLPSAVTARYIKVVSTEYGSGMTNLSLTEARALSLAAPLVIPLSRNDAIRALQIAGGIAPAVTAAEKTKYDQNSNGKVEIDDAVSIFKKAQ